MRTKTGIPKNAFIPKRRTVPKPAVQKADVEADELNDGLDKLSAKQWNAIASLLEGKTLQAAADACNINVRTLRRWLHDADFSEEYTRARRQHLDNIAGSLLTAAQDAAETLMRLLKCGDPLIELRAAKAILQISQKSVENSDVQKRVRDLEKHNALQAVQIHKLEATNKLLQQSKDEYGAMSHSLITGTFQRPDWITSSAWDKIVRGNSPNRQ